jgi:hypothetical protein
VSEGIFKPARWLPLLLLLTIVACSNRPSIAARASVETFYSAVQNDDVPLMEDNLAAGADPGFVEHVHQAAASAQSDPAVRASVQVTRIEQPSISGNNARVRVQFADGQSDTVLLGREGLRWKVLSSGRLR